MPVPVILWLASLQWNFVMNSIGFSLEKGWVGVGFVGVEFVGVRVATAEAKSERPLRTGQGLCSQWQGWEGEAEALQTSLGYGTTAEGSVWRRDACLKWRETSVYLQRWHLGSPLAKSSQQFDWQLAGILSSQQATISWPHCIWNDCSSLGTNVFLWYVRLSTNSPNPK